MLTTSALRKWYWVHQWTSLVCTLCLLLLCLTGLPLIFRHELDHALGNSVHLPEAVASAAEHAEHAGSAPPQPSRGRPQHALDATLLLLSQPLHFGDYCGLPLQIIWPLLDVLAIAVLGSGVYLWLEKWRVPVEARIAALQAEAAE